MLFITLCVQHNDDFVFYGLFMTIKKLSKNFYKNLNLKLRKRIYLYVNVLFKRCKYTLTEKYDMSKTVSRSFLITGGKRK